MYKRVQLILAVLILLAVGCQKNEIETVENQDFTSPEEFYRGLKGASKSVLTSESLDEINIALEKKNLNYRVATAEYLTAGGSEEIGHLVISKYVGNKHTEADFVPGDPRRFWSGANGTKITYALDNTADMVPPGGLYTAEQAAEAIVKGFNSWEALKCSKLGLTLNDDYGEDIGYVAYIFGTGGSPYSFADIQMAGWGDIDFPGDVLGVTFTFVFAADGEPTDIDNNKMQHVAFREIYFDPSWIWSITGEDGIDIESIAVHEIGHGLSQGHFGTTSINKDNEIKVTPRAVMNPFYESTFRVLQNTDIGGHASLWGSWPKN